MSLGEDALTSSEVRQQIAADLERQERVVIWAHLAGAGLALPLIFLARDLLPSLPIIVLCTLAAILANLAFRFLLGRGSVRWLGLISVALDLLLVTANVLSNNLDSFSYTLVYLMIIVVAGIRFPIWGSILSFALYLAVDLGMVLSAPLTPELLTQAGVRLFLSFAVVLSFGYLGHEMQKQRRGRIAALVQSRRLFEQTQRSLVRRTSLLEVNEAISSTLELKPLLGLIVERLPQIVPNVFTAVWVVEEQQVRLFVAQGTPPGSAPPETLLVGEGIAGAVAKTGSPLLAADVPGPAEGNAGQGRSVLAVPLHHGKETLGVLELHRADAQGFSEEDQEALALFTGQASIAIQNARLLEQVEQRARQSQEINEIFRTIGASTSLEELFEAVAFGLRQLLDFDRAALALVEAESGRIRLSALFPPGAPLVGNLLTEGRYLPEDSPTAWVIRNLKPRLHSDLAQEAAIASERGLADIGFRSVLSVPLLLGPKALGATILVSKTARAFNEEHMKLLQQLSFYMAGAIERLRLLKESEQERERIEVLGRIASLLNSSLDFQTTCESMAHELQQLVPFERLTVLALDEARGELEMLVAFDKGRMHQTDGLRFPISDTPSGGVLEPHTVLFRNDLEAERTYRTDEVLYKLGIRSMVTLPLVHHDRLIGTFNVSSHTKHAFASTHLQILEPVAEQLAAALSNSQLLKRADIRAARLETINRLAKLVSASLDIQDIFAAFHSEIESVIPFDALNFTLIDAEAKAFEVVAQYAKTPFPVAVGQRFPLEGSATEWTLQQGRPLVRSNLAEEQSFPLESPLVGAGYSSFLLLPLQTGGRDLGALMLASHEANLYGGEEIGFLESVAEHLALAIAHTQLYTEAKTSAEQLAVLNRIANIVNSGLDLSATFEVFVSEARKLIDFDRAAVALARPEGDLERVVVSATGEVLLAAGSQGSRIPREHSGSGWVAAHKEPLIRHDIAQEEEGYAVDQELIRAGLRSSLIVPLLVSNEAIGALALTSTQPGHFGEQHLEVVRRLAEHLATAVQNHLLYLDVTAKAERLAVLNRVAQLVNSSLDLPRVFEACAKELHTLLPFDRASITVLRSEKEALERFVVSSSLGERTPSGKGTLVPIGGSASGWVVLNQKPLIQQDLAAKQDFPQDQELLKLGMRSTIRVPLTSQSKAIGTLTLSSQEPNTYSERHLDILLPLAEHFASAVANNLLFEETERLSITDPLTELYNRRFFGQMLGLELERGSRMGYPVGLLIVDLDGFKAINDVFGHLVGDEALRTVARLLQDNLRRTDTLARFGGDEFVALLPGVTQKELEVVAKKLQEALLRAPIHPSDHDQPVRLTLSMGAAFFPGDAQDASSLLARADNALYRAKASGGNRLEAHKSMAPGKAAKRRAARKAKS